LRPIGASMSTQGLIVVVVVVVLVLILTGYIVI
jgi:hypothetical protein